MEHKTKKMICALFAVWVSASANAAPAEVALHFVDDKGVTTSAGVVQYEDTEFGLLLTPKLTGLSRGQHGFHIHEKPSCAPAMVNEKLVAAGGAGAHYDPDKTGKHGSPYDKLAHRGDLPALFVADDGTATYPVLAPRLMAKELQGRSIMIHVGGDNQSDSPNPLGGGGARLACGVF